LSFGDKHQFFKALKPFNMSFAKTFSTLPELAYSATPQLRNRIAFRLFILLSIFTSTICKGQDDCDPNTPHLFAGIPSTTLCEKYTNTTFEIKIGKSTQFPTASSYVLATGTSVITGNVLVVDDFEVDVTFSFSNAVVKVQPRKKIRVSASWITSSGLSVFNSVFFACDEMWSGIELGNTSVLWMQNSTIEDAIEAVKANEMTAIFLIANKFNRNWTGLALGSNAWVVEFSGNNFVCDAPLYEPFANMSSQYGITLYGAAIFNPVPKKRNSFSGLNFGIYTFGQNVVIQTQWLEMNKIFNTCIRMEYANIKLKACRFTSFAESGLLLKESGFVEIKDCRFEKDPLITGVDYNQTKCIKIGKVLIGSIRISDNKFYNRQDNTPQSFTGIDLTGSAGMSTKVQITQNDFHIVNLGEGFCYGIYVNMFSQSEEMLIAENHFRIGGVKATVLGITLSQVSKFWVVQNSFTPYASLAVGININECDALDGKVTANSFHPAYLANTICDLGLAAIVNFNSKNIEFCFNHNYHSFSSTFNFIGFCPGTLLKENLTIGSGNGILLANDPTIGPQGDEVNFPANEWDQLIWCNPQQTGTGDCLASAGCSFVVPTFSVECRGCDAPNQRLRNQFTVNTPQSVLVQGIGLSPHFPFHPVNISHSDLFVVNSASQPTSNCNFPGPILPLDKGIVSSTFPSYYLDDLGLKYDLEKYLLDKIQRNPALKGAPDFDSFYEGKNGTSMHQLSAFSEQLYQELRISSADQAMLQDLSQQWQDLLDTFVIRIPANPSDFYPYAFEALTAQIITKKGQIETLVADMQSNRTAVMMSAYQAADNISATNQSEFDSKLIFKAELGSTDSLTFAELERLKVLANLAGTLQATSLSNRAFFLINPCATIPPSYPSIPLNPPVIGGQVLERSNFHSAELDVSPNPSTSDFQATIDRGQITSIAIIDMFGRVRKVQNVGTSTVSIHTELESGIYTLIVTTNSNDILYEKVAIVRN
jgi:hypothetical protein